jgi:hypothetical protein
VGCELIEMIIFVYDAIFVEMDTVVFCLHKHFSRVNHVYRIWLNNNKFFVVFLDSASLLNKFG